MGCIILIESLFVTFLYPQELQSILCGCDTLHSFDLS